MMIHTVRLNKKFLRLVLFVLAALAAALILRALTGGGGREHALPDNDSRIAYLRDWGWEVGTEPIATLHLMIPDPLTEEYAAYNELQKEQGFDLEAWRGKSVTRYTYEVLNYPNAPEGVQLDLYVCGDRAVAGDVVRVGEDGFMDTLRFPKTAK